MSHEHSRSSADADQQRKRMLEAPVKPLIINLAIPTIISMLVTAIYNLADTYFVSQINTSASGAVGIVFSLMAIIQAVGFTVGTGSGSIASRFLGQGRADKAGEYASSAVVLALVLGLVLTGGGLFFLKDLIWLLGSTETIYPYAMDYAFFILMGAPVMAVSFTLNNVLRWQGKAKLSVIGLTTGGVLNMILDPIFIFGLDMGIMGASLATFLSQCISMIILSAFFFMKLSDIRVSIRLVSRSPRIYLHILKQGMPSFFRQSILSVSVMALNFNAKIYGDAAIAALAIVTKVFNFLQSIIIGFGQGFQPVIGYNYGAGRMDRVREGLLFSLKSCTAILSTGAVLGFAFAPQIITLFLDDPLVVSIGARAFRYQCFTLPLMPILTFSNMLFQALGKSLPATLLAVCRQGVFIPLVYLLSWQFGLTGLLLSQPLSDLFACLFSACIMYRLLQGELKQQPETVEPRST